MVPGQCWLFALSCVVAFCAELAQAVSYQSTDQLLEGNVRISRNTFFSKMNLLLSVWCIAQLFKLLGWNGATLTAGNWWEVFACRNLNVAYRCYITVVFSFSCNWS